MQGLLCLDQEFQAVDSFTAGQGCVFSTYLLQDFEGLEGTKCSLQNTGDTVFQSNVTCTCHPTAYYHDLVVHATLLLVRHPSCCQLTGGFGGHAFANSSLHLGSESGND